MSDQDLNDEQRFSLAIASYAFLKNLHNSNASVFNQIANLVIQEEARAGETFELIKRVNDQFLYKEHAMLSFMYSDKATEPSIKLAESFSRVAYKYFKDSKDVQAALRDATAQMRAHENEAAKDTMNMIEAQNSFLSYVLKL